MSDNSLNAVMKPVISKKLALSVALGWALLVMAGFVLLYQFTVDDRLRNQQQWQRQIQLTVDSQRRQVEQWLGTQQSVVTSLAQNTSLQLYITELNQLQNASPSEHADEAFTSFLRNLLISESQQHGFHEPSGMEEVPANVPVPLGSGIAILDQKYQPIVRTSGMPGMADLPKDVAHAFIEKRSPVGPFLLNNKSYLLFSAPISSIGSDVAQGYIVGMKAVDASLAELLALPPQAADSSESLLVEQEGEGIVYLTALADGTNPLSLTLDANTKNLAAAYAVHNPGSFTQMQDYQGTQVLVVGQSIAGTQWTLVHKVDAAVAFYQARKRSQSLMIGYVLLAGLLTMAVLAIWRNLSAARAKQTALYFQQLSIAAQRQKSLLSRLIDTLIMLVDSRDPHAQNHSNHVALIAGSVATHMALDEPMHETTVLAASLMNVGKIKTPEALLTGKDLSNKDKDSIRKSMLASADILKDVAFDGPVVETLKQSLEHVDGTGPLGLKGDEILLSARIIAVANAFIAMISARAYRQAMSVDQALDVIHGSVDTLYARPVVAALEHYLENDGGREALEKL